MDLDVITPGVPTKDGCPILRRIKAFISQEGVCSKLLYVYLNANGTPINLSTGYVAVSESADSLPVSEGPDDRTLIVKFREFNGRSIRPDKVWVAEGEIISPTAGQVAVVLPKPVYSQCGIYQIAWGFVEHGALRLVQQSLLSVERSLFGFDTSSRVRTEGPPTLGEIRMQIMDSDPNENILLRDTEFSDDQLILAMAKPIEEFNAMSPPLHLQYDTRNFPWRSQWIDAVIGYLLRFAANSYRRNHLAITAGGKQLDDLNREREYLQASMMYLQEWREFAQRKKIEINLRGCVGQMGSSYTDYRYR